MYNLTVEGFIMTGLQKADGFQNSNLVKFIILIDYETQYNMLRISAKRSINEK